MKVNIERFREMPGSTEKSFVEQFVENWFSINAVAPSYREIHREIEGIGRWHKVIGSTPPRWWNPQRMSILINQACVRREAEMNPWLNMAVRRDLSMLESPA